MPIDNFELIIPLLTFDSEDEFYFLQVIQRKKDFIEGQTRLGRDNNNRLIKAYYIYSVDQLQSYKSEIVQLCQLFNARAGINLNKRSQKDVALKVLEILAVALRKNEFSGVSKIYNSACGKESSTDKSWLVDIDTQDQTEISEIIKTVEDCEPYGQTKVIEIIPSRAGAHLITKRFNRQTFKNIFPEVEVHTNNPTNLFIP